MLLSDSLLAQSFDAPRQVALHQSSCHFQTTPQAKIFHSLSATYDWLAQYANGAMLKSTNKPGAEEDQASVEDARDAISSYTRIVERRLKPSLDAASTLRDKAFNEIAELKQMSTALEAVILTREENVGTTRRTDESGAPVPALETRVNIGEEFYVRANVYELDHVIVDIGLGVMLEMTLEEARVFIDERLSALEEQVKKHSSRIAEIQAHLQGITECLAELKLTTGACDLFSSASGTGEV